MFIEEYQFLKASVVAMETMRDPVLGKVLQFTQQGWPNNLEAVFQPYYGKRLELFHEDGILLWNLRVVVPESLQALLLADLHPEHLGMGKVKQLARKDFCWPGLDKQIEETVKLCPACQESAKSPASAPTTSWSWPGGPWKRLHVDFAGPYLGNMLLVVVDAYSKLLEIVPMTHTTSTNTITALIHIFCYFGLPEHLLTDNENQFTHDKFQKFLRENDILRAITASTTSCYKWVNRTLCGRI